MISVILTAYRRKEFLKEALSSLNNQNFRDFEVILITNFEFPLDDYNKINIKHIIRDGNIGLFLYEAIKASNGGILVFMDDDDIFAINKLYYINNALKNENILYFHNYPLFVNGREKKRLFVPPDFNMSCISIRRTLLDPYLDDLRTLIAGQDSFIYCCGLCSKNKIKNRRVRLTYYREHKNKTSDISNDKKWLIMDLEALDYMENIFKCAKAKKYLNTLRYSVAIKLDLFYDDSTNRHIDLSIINKVLVWIYLVYTLGILKKKLILVIRKLFYRIYKKLLC